MGNGHAGLQILGSVAIYGCAALLAAIGASAERYGRYGREALLCAAGLMATGATVRVITTAGVLTQVEGRVVNGLLAFPFLAILIELMVLQRMEERGEKPHRLRRRNYD